MMLLKRVSVRLETIKVTNRPQSSMAPAESNFYGDAFGKCIDYGMLEEIENPGLEATSNFYTAELVHDSSRLGKFSTVYNRYSNACSCIGIEGPNKALTIYGSGTFFGRHIFVTAAHIFDHLSDQELVTMPLSTELEIDHRQSQHSSSVMCQKIRIKLGISEMRIHEQRDIAILILDELTQQDIQKFVKYFPKTEPKRDRNMLFMAMHYANGGHQQITIGKSGRSQYEEFTTERHIDGGRQSSGAAIFSLAGHVTDIHLGHIKGREMIRGSIAIEDVIAAEMELCGSSYMKHTLTPEAATQFTDRTYRFVDVYPELLFQYEKEGGKSQKLLLNKIEAKNGGPDAAITLTKTHLPSIKDKPTLGYIQTTYAPELSQTITESIGYGGKHGATSEWSFSDEIESDHFPPFDAYSKVPATSPHYATVSKYKAIKIVRIGKKTTIRKHENDLPALTIPYDIHRNLRTTGSEQTSQDFRDEQTRLMSIGQFNEAIKLNLDEYVDKGLFDPTQYPNIAAANFPALVTKYKQGISDALDRHVALSFITAQQKVDLLAHLSSKI